MAVARLRVAVAVVAAAVVLLAVPTAYAVDNDRLEDRVERNVEVAGEDVGGMTPGDLDRALREVADRYRTATIEVDAPGGGFTLNGSDIGLHVDTAATARAVLDVGRGGSLPSRFGNWVSSFFETREVDVRTELDEAALHRVVLVADKGPHEVPAEPTIRLGDGGRFVAVEGKAGQGVDPVELARRIREETANGTRVRVEVERAAVRPRFTLQDAERLAAEANETAATPLVITAGGTRATVPPATIRSWLRAEPSDGGLVLGADDAKVATDSARLLSSAATPAVETRFTVSGGQPQVIAGKSGTACCQLTAVPLVKQALRDRPATPVDLPMRTVEPRLTAEAALRLGIKQEVGTFTTNHKAGEPRVQNIHRIADLLRGQVIRPGQTFSVNQFVGPRTLEKGFVPAPQIGEDRRIEDAVGGGISQFATTMFNAAFFAGLDFAEYQPHTQWFSRYPRGREATLSYPHPDLRIRNTTPYGILIWPTYNNTSITVTLYSTKYVEAAQTAQVETDAKVLPEGPCKLVRTTRTRSYLDGRKTTDTFSAVYAPEEGVRC